MDSSTAEVVLGIFHEMFWTIRMLGMCVILREVAPEALRLFNDIYVEWKAPGASFTGRLSRPSASPPSSPKEEKNQERRRWFRRKGGHTRGD